MTYIGKTLVAQMRLRRPRIAGNRGADRSAYSFLQYGRRWRTCGLSREQVTHRGLQATDRGQPLQLQANVIGLHMLDVLHEQNADHGYLEVSSHADGFVHLAQNGRLQLDSVAAVVPSIEYRLGTVAMIASKGLCRQRLSVDEPARAIA
jgi:hypothetical protein